MVDRETLEEAPREQRGVSRGFKVLVISLAVGVLVAGVVFFVVRELQQPWFSPPDEARDGPCSCHKGCAG